MTDTKFEILFENYKIKSKELADEEALVNLDLNSLTWDEPKSYYKKLDEYCECAKLIEEYLKSTYGFDTYQTLTVLYGTRLEDILSGKVERDRKYEIGLFTQEFWRRHKKSFEELGK